MAASHRVPSVASVPHDRADDEKTIHAEREDTEKKDPEAGHPLSPTGSGSIKLQETNQDSEYRLEDDFPDGGAKAWTVVLGVSHLHRPLRAPLTAR